MVAGHSEGSTIATKMANELKNVTHLIYSSCYPMGRRLSIIQQNRTYETDTDSTKYSEYNIDDWATIVANKNEINTSQGGDGYNTTYEFSEPMKTYLEKMKITVLVTCGTKDCSTSYNDLLRVNIIRQKKDNFPLRLT